MGGFSVVLLMSIFSFMFLFFLAVFAGVAIYTVVSYAFESIFIMARRKKSGYRCSFTAWIPFYNKYLLGKIAGSSTLGAVTGVLALVSVGLSTYLYIHREPELVPFMILALILLVVFILNTIIAHRVYAKSAGKYSDALTILSVLSLGLLRPVFLFALRNTHGRAPACQADGTDI